MERSQFATRPSPTRRQQGPSALSRVLTWLRGLQPQQWLWLVASIVWVLAVVLTWIAAAPGHATLANRAALAWGVSALLTALGAITWGLRDGK